MRLEQLIAPAALAQFIDALDWFAEQVATPPASEGSPEGLD
jgi:hypothetical protein